MAIFIYRLYHENTVYYGICTYGEQSGRMARMTVPKEINLPERDFAELFNHHPEVSAKELVEALGGKRVELQQSGTMTLSEDSLQPNLNIPAAPFLDLPVGSNTLSGFVGTEYGQLREYADMYSQFGMSVIFKPEDRIVEAHVAETQVGIFQGQTFYNYSDAVYLHMIYGLLACFSDGDQELIRDIQQKGVLISTSQRATQTALLVPGDMARSFLPRLRFQRPYERGVLYPVNIEERIYTIWDMQQRTDVRAGVNALLAALRPVGVRVRNDSVVNIFLKKR